MREWLLPTVFDPGRISTRPTPGIWRLKMTTHPLSTDNVGCRSSLELRPSNAEHRLVHDRNASFIDPNIGPSSGELGIRLGDAQDCAPGDLPPFNAFVDSFSLFQRSDVGDQRPHLPSRNQIEGFQYLDAGYVATAQDRLLLQ